MSDIITITALIYTDSDAADRALRDVAMTLIERGSRLAGLVQRNTARPGRSRCDMVLEELASGELIGISQDRGPLARGCALDVGQLLGAMQIVRAALVALVHAGRLDAGVLAAAPVPVPVTAAPWSA